MKRYPKCQLCGKDTAWWAAQLLADSYDGCPVTFCLLGNHYRGWPLVKVCDACQEMMRKQTIGLTHAQVRELEYCPVCNHLTEPEGHLEAAGGYSACQCGERTKHLSL